MSGNNIILKNSERKNYMHLRKQFRAKAKAVLLSSSEFSSLLQGIQLSL